jgi:hypothetical protein
MSAIIRSAIWASFGLEHCLVYVCVAQQIAGNTLVGRRELPKLDLDDTLVLVPCHLAEPDSG